MPWVFPMLPVAERPVDPVRRLAEELTFGHRPP